MVINTDIIEREIAFEQVQRILHEILDAEQYEHIDTTKLILGKLATEILTLKNINKGGGLSQNR